MEQRLILCPLCTQDLGNIEEASKSLSYSIYKNPGIAKNDLNCHFCNVLILMGEEANAITYLDDNAIEPGVDHWAWRHEFILDKETEMVTVDNPITGGKYEIKKHDTRIEPEEETVVEVQQPVPQNSIGLVTSKGEIIYVDPLEVGDTVSSDETILIHPSDTGQIQQNASGEILYVVGRFYRFQKDEIIESILLPLQSEG